MHTHMYIYIYVALQSYNILSYIYSYIYIHIILYVGRINLQQRWNLQSLRCRCQDRQHAEIALLGDASLGADHVTFRGLKEMVN